VIAAGYVFKRRGFFNELSRQEQPVVIVGASLAWDLARRHGLKAVYVYTPKPRPFIMPARDRANPL